MKVKSESEVIQSYPTPSDPMDCSLPGSSVHGIFQTRVLEWGAIAFSAGECYSCVSNCLVFQIRSVAQSCMTLSDPMDCSPLGSSVPGILQARILERVAISFSSA